MLVVGCMGFGLVLGWSGGFAGRRWPALAWRLATGAVALAGLLILGGGALVAGIAGFIVGAAGHELFAFTAARRA